MISLRRSFCFFEIHSCFSSFPGRARDRLTTIKEQLSESDLENIIEKTTELKKLQATKDSPEAKATIPRLTLNDLPREVIEYPRAITENEKGTGVTVLRHELGSTSGVAYVGLGADVSSLPLDDAFILISFLV
jgi:Zn-dependent M16 (insulinase) family peptidase